MVRRRGMFPDHYRRQERYGSRGPVPRPQTIAKSLSIGTPADGYYAIRTMKETAGRLKTAPTPKIRGCN